MRKINLYLIYEWFNGKFPASKQQHKLLHCVCSNMFWWWSCISRIFLTCANDSGDRDLRSLDFIRFAQKNHHNGPWSHWSFFYFDFIGLDYVLAGNFSLFHLDVLMKFSYILFNVYYFQKIKKMHWLPLNLLSLPSLYWELCCAFFSQFHNI